MAKYRNLVICLKVGIYNLIDKVGYLINVVSNMVNLAKYMLHLYIKNANNIVIEKSFGNPMYIPFATGGG